MHLDFPPLRKTWSILPPVVPPVFRWFTKIAPGLESLKLTTYEDDFGPNCLSPQSLAIASAVCSNLEELNVESLAPLGRILPSVGLFGQIGTLTIESHTDFTDKENAMAWTCLSGLKSLQVGVLHKFMVVHGTCANSAAQQHGWREQPRSEAHNATLHKSRL